MSTGQKKKPTQPQGQGKKDQPAKKDQPKKKQQPPPAKKEQAPKKEQVKKDQPKAQQKPKPEQASKKPQPKQPQPSKPAQQKAATKPKAQAKGKAPVKPKPKAKAKPNQKKEQKKAHREKVSEKKSGQKSPRSPKGDLAAAQKLARERLQVIIRSKYQNPASTAKPSELESKICEYLVDLEASDKDLRGSLRDLGIVAAREQPITATKKAIVIFVPFRQLHRWRKIQGRVGVELEKKFSGQDVLFLAQRKVMKLHDIKNNYPRPINQTITNVHESILNDLVYPTKIVGKRLRFRVGGKRILKVYLDPKNSKEIEPKLQTYETVYRKLTKKIVTFLFPRYVI